MTAKAHTYEVGAIAAASCAFCAVAFNSLATARVDRRRQADLRRRQS